MRPCSRFVAGFVAVLAVSALTACARRSQLEARALQLAGPSAMSCGHVLLHEDGTKVRDCVERALAEGVVFRAGVERMGIDSQVAEILVRSPGGKLTLLRFDSDIYGGSSLFPRAELFERPCSSVSPVLEGGDPARLFFQCR